MKPIKAFMLVLILGLTAMVYATDSSQATGKEKTGTCCCMSTASCCMEMHKHHSSQAMKDSCETGKGEMNCCCASMTGNSNSGAAQQGLSCCQAHHSGNKQAGTESTQIRKGNKPDCCMGCESCCHDSAECKTATVKR